MARGRGRKKKEKKPPVEWTRMHQVEETVADLVRKHHSHLERATIFVLGKPKASKRSGGKVNVAKARRCTEALRALVKDEIGEAHYIIEVGKDAWEALSQDTKKIVLDHELCHFAGQDDKGKWGLLDHDVAEFRSIIERYGLYSADLELFAKTAAEQLELAVGKA